MKTLNIKVDRYAEFPFHPVIVALFHHRVGNETQSIDCSALPSIITREDAFT